MKIIFFSNGKAIAEVTPDDASYRYRKISGEDRIQLSFTSAKMLSLPVGMTLSYQGKTYTLLSPATITKVNESAWKYALTLDAPSETLRKWRMKHRTDGSVKFNLTARPEEHLRMLIDCANAAEPQAREKWEISSVIDAPEKLISYDHCDLLSALALIARIFDTEWLVEGKRITLGKIEANKSAPLALAYGQGKGIRSGLRRENDSKHTRISRLYVQGSDRNIRHDKYGSKSLHLPAGVLVQFDGERFSGEAGYRADSAFSYRVSPKGDYVERTQAEGLTGAEGSLDATDVYPSRVGQVTKFEQVKGETKDKHPLFAFFDTSIPETLDYTQCVIPNQPLTIIFQSGILSGQTFEAEYTHKDRRFVLIGKEVDRVWMPESPYIAKAGDKYAVYSVELPASYIRDDKTKTGAEWELLRRALKHLHEASQHPYTYRAELDGLWAKKDWVNRGGKIVLGGYVRLTDPDLIPEGVDLRITGIKDYLISPEMPEIELGTSAVGSSILTTIEKLRQDDAKQMEEARRAGEVATRSINQAIEASEKITHAYMAGFGRDLSASTLKTMQTLVGDPSSHIRFLQPAQWGVSWSASNKVLTLPAGKVEHQTLGLPDNVLTPDKSMRRQWAVAKFVSPALTDKKKSYYVYLRGEANGSATYRLEGDPLPFVDGTSHNLLLGILSSEDDAGGRSFSRLYGFSEVLPGQVTTEVLRSSGGETTINLNTGEIVSKKIIFVYPDGSQHPYPDSYLHQAIKEGSTEIQGGLVLGSVIGAKDTSGAVTSYLSGLGSLPAFSAGVTNFGKPSEKRVVEINHDGTGHWGAMYIEQGGRVIAFRKAGEDGEASLRIGGGQTPLEDLLRKSTQDESINVQVAGQQVTQTSYEQGIKVVKIASIPIKVLNEGSTIELTVPWNIAIQHTNTDKTKITSKAVLVLKMTDDKGRVAYDFTEYFASGANKGWRIDRLNTPLRHRKAGYSAGNYTLTIEAHISTEIAEGGSYSGAPAKTTFTSQPFTLSYLILGVNASIKESVFGEQGMSIFFGKKRVYYLSKNERDPFLTIRGLVDSPGVLLAGEVWMRDSQSLRGNPENLHGSIVARFASQRSKLDAIRYERRSSGHYLVHHNIGHTNYSVQLTPLFADGWNNSAAYTLRVQEKTDNSFVVRCTRWEGGYRGMVEEDYLAFSFLVIGDNY